MNSVFVAKVVQTLHGTLTKVFVTPILWSLLICAWPSVAAAQERAGFWIGFGVGAGSGDVSADNAAGTITGNDRDGGAVTDLELGWTLDHQWLIGFDLNTWAKSRQEGSSLQAIFVTASGTFTFYPSRTAGFFVKGGAGVSSVIFQIDEAPDRRSSATAGKGLGLMTGAGYDFRLGRGFFLVPEVSFQYGQPGDINFLGETQFRNWKQNTVDVTVSIVFHQMRN